MNQNKRTFFVAATILLFTIFSLLFPIFSIEARSGCCSHHDGVCCSCGSQPNGKVICNDGNRNSSCYYSEMVKCGGSNDTPVLKLAPTDPPTYQYIAPKPTVVPTAIPRRAVVEPTIKPVATSIPVFCSAVSDSICPSHCTAGNDADCCTKKLYGHTWYDNWGCYPSQLSCSAEKDGICDWYCSAGNDADCCTQRLYGYAWYDNWGCYPAE